MAEQPELSFAGLLRQLRAEAWLTQEELAEAAGISPRSVSDLEQVWVTGAGELAALVAGPDRRAVRHKLPSAWGRLRGGQAPGRSTGGCS